MSFPIIPNRNFLTGILFIFIHFQVAAQEQPGRQSLEKVLRILEEKYQVSFTYADENIAGKSIIPPADDLELEHVLHYLEQNTSLIFRQLDDRFITISLPIEESGSICGIVADLESREKLIGATILSGTRVAVSDETGYFDLHPVPEDENITIQYIGYQDLRIPTSSFTSARCDTIYLRPDIIRLREIFVTNYLIEGIDKKADGTFVIDTETLGILPGLIEPDVLQTVQALPGIQSVNEMVSDINIRGGTHDQNLILWDGIKMYQSGHFFGLISAFNPYLTKTVSLIKNGTSAFYGDGVSGTIDMQTDDQLAPRFSGGAGINMINADIFARIPISKKASMQVSGRRSIADLVKTPTYQKYYERAFRDAEITNTPTSADSLLTSNENFYFYDFSLNFLYNISPKDELKINFLYINNNIDYREHATYDTLIDSKTSGLKQRSLVVGISYNRIWNEKFQTRTFIYLSSYQLNAVNHDIFNDQRLIQENEVMDTGLKLEGDWGISKHFHLLSGYQFFEVGIGNLEDINNPVYRRYIKRVVRNHVLYGEGNYLSQSRRTNIRGGIRGNYISKFNLWIFEPRLAFNQRITDYLSIEILGEIKSQTTTQVIDFQNDFLGIEKRRWVLSNNEDIPVIKSRQASLGIHYQPKNLLISLEGYYKQVEGIISSSQGFQNQFQFVRSNGKYDVFGLDFLINRKFGNLSTWLSYSIAKNTYEFLEFEPTEFPNNLDIKHTITFGTSCQINHFQLSAGLNWHTGIPYTQPSAAEPFINNRIHYEVPNTTRLDDYSRLDLSAKYWFRLGSGKTKATLGTSIWNVLNHENLISIYYMINDQGEIEQKNRYSLGFTPNLMFRIDF